MPLRNQLVPLMLLIGVSAPLPLLAQSEKPQEPQSAGEAETGRAKLLRTDSPAPYVHRLTLYDHAGEPIDPTSAEARPYSPKMTCGKCHPYAEIAHGWHFNSAGGAGILPAGPGTMGGTGVPPVAADAHNDRLKTGSTGELADGRPGEPWIFADTRLGVQIPLSLRGWPGTFTPGQLGLTSWQFTLQFGRHLCGGGFAEGPSESAPLAGARGSDVPQPPAAADLAPRGGARGSSQNAAIRNETATSPGATFAATTDAETKRWAISGPLEIDCMICHATMASGYDAGEVERQIERQNFRWSATAALGLGVIRGDARTVSSEYDPENPPPPDRPDLTLPKVEFDRNKFDADYRAFFDIVRRPPSERCMFCHATRPVGSHALEEWEQATDVHLASGMSCTDCHRNGIDHRVSRGESTGDTPFDPMAASLTCRGCHEGAADLPLADAKQRRQRATTPEEALGGRYGAPYPQHAGIPPLHFDKLACTACHSGPWPDAMGTQRVQTSLAHALGVSTKERRDDALPEIVEPVFALEKSANRPAGSENNSANTIAPKRMIRPAYWGRRAGDKTEPLPLDVVAKAAGRALPKLKGASYEQSPEPLKDEQIEQVLTALKPRAGEGAEPVYIRDGSIFSLGADGQLTRSAPSAGSFDYVWPLAHNVRPARQALGVVGCKSCHATESALFFGKVAAFNSDSKAASSQPARVMSEFNGLDAAMAGAWGRIFELRGIGKIFLAASILLIDGVLLGWLWAAIAGIPSRTPTRTVVLLSRLAMIVTLIGACIQAATAFVPARMEHWPLLLHSVANPILIVGLLAWAIFWSRLCSGRATWREWVTWLTLCAGLGVITVMLLAMLPLFGTESMRELLDWHERFGIALLVGLAAVILLSLTVRPAPQK